MRSKRLSILLTGLTLSSSLPLAAVDYIGPTASVGNWGDNANWYPAGLTSDPSETAPYPDGIGAVARMVVSSNANRQKVTLSDASGADASFTVGTLSIGFNGGAATQHYQVNNVSGGTGRLTFDVSSGNASLLFNNIFADGTLMSVNVGLTLNDNLAITSSRSGTTTSINRDITSGVAGTGIIVNSGPGTVILTAASTYSGDTKVNAGGKLRLSGGTDRLPTGTNLILDGGASSSALLEIQSINQTVRSLSGASGVVAAVITNSSTGTGTANLTVSSTAVNSSFAGIIQDGATAKMSLTKDGANTTLTLTGGSTYTSATTVEEGALLLQGGSLGNTAVAVNSGGSFGGAGTVLGGVTVAGGGVLLAGNSIGTLNTGTVSLGAGATYQLELNTTAGTTDLINITGDLLLSAGGGTLLTLADLGGNVTTNAVFTIATYTGTWNNEVFTLGGDQLEDDSTFTFGNNTYLINYNNGNAVTLTAVPEPGVALLLGLSLGAVFPRTRRHRA
jgi:autotransporter-associated beta strand protein